MFGEDTLFEKMVSDFEAIENDPNKNVDEQETQKELNETIEVFQNKDDAAKRKDEIETEIPRSRPRIRRIQVDAEDISHVGLRGIGFANDLRQGDLGYVVDDEDDAVESWGLKSKVLESKTNEEEVEDDEKARARRKASAARHAEDVYPELTPASKKRYVADVDEQEVNEVFKTEEDVSKFVEKNAKVTGTADTRVSVRYGDKLYQSEDTHDLVVQICKDKNIACESKTNEEENKVDTVSNDPSFEQTVAEFAQIERDPNKNVDEEEVEEDIKEGAQEDYDAAIGSLVALVSEFIGEDVPQEQIEMVLHNLVLGGGAAGLDDAVRAYGNLRAEMDIADPTDRKASTGEGELGYKGGGPFRRESEAKVVEQLTPRSDDLLYIRKSHFEDTWDLFKTEEGSNTATQIFTFVSEEAAAAAASKIADAIGGEFRGKEDPRRSEGRRRTEAKVNELDYFGGAPGGQAPSIFRRGGKGPGPDDILCPVCGMFYDKSLASCPYCYRRKKAKEEQEKYKENEARKKEAASGDTDEAKTNEEKLTEAETYEPGDTVYWTSPGAEVEIIRTITPDDPDFMKYVPSLADLMDSHPEPPFYLVDFDGDTELVPSNELED